MSMATKRIDCLPVSAEKLEAARRNNLVRMVEDAAAKVEAKFKPLCEYFTERFSAGDWILMNRARQEHLVYYVHGIAGVLPDLTTQSFGAQYGERNYENRSLDFAGFTGELPTENAARYCFGEGTKYFKSGGNIYFNGTTYGGLNFKRGTEIYFLYGNESTYETHLQGTCNTSLYIAHIPVYLFNGRNKSGISAAQAFLYWLFYDLTPEKGEFDSKTQYNLYDFLHKLYKTNGKFLSATQEAITLDCKEVMKALEAGEEISIWGDVLKFSDDTELEADIEFIKQFEDDLLTCDQKRADLSPYGRNLLVGPNEGHWDLWDIPDGVGEIHLKESYTARDPASDVSVGVAAIDFGTKTTVVVCEDEMCRQLPLKVGSGDYKSGVSANNYENPTVMQFINFESFLKAYKARPGRPYTSWNDVTVSHTAFQNLTQTSSDKYYSFLEGLKHWCGTADEEIKIKDAAGNEWNLPPFLQLTDEQPNPIEIYAYYLGLYINNMMRHEIITSYRLSFPVTYERQVREKIRQSFEQGIKKSLPTALLANEEVMEDFYVEEGASEPAAYAICALNGYGFAPEGEEEIYYAVFDFGGGTTDFDFGVYKDGPDGQNRYDYSLVHFGANGDRTLGGENLLRLLAFNVFKANAEKLLHPNESSAGAVIPFTYATARENFMGSESLINETSQEARANMKTMMEALRPVWEKPESEEAKKICTEGVMVDLFDAAGNKMTGITLDTGKRAVDVSTDNAQEGDSVEYLVDLRTILRNRIEKGIKNFFYSMAQAFNSRAAQDGYIKPISETGEMAVFLAGNSSKSQLVKDIFSEYIGEGGKAAEILGVSPETLDFRLYPPLGTSEAIALQRERGLDVSEDQMEIMEHPTGKTGVAFGLLWAENIEVIDLAADEESGETFQYYIGRNDKGKFCPVFGREAKLGEWHEFMSDATGSFTILYSDQAEADTGSAPVTVAKKRPVRLKVSYPEARVYVRPVSAHTIEWAVAVSSESLEAGELLLGSKSPIELK